uniref:Uncharacterized protein n=1 Tax=Odontella aurita TaxID=265563 RepID=A0A7S4JIC7_9STRA
MVASALSNQALPRLLGKILDGTSSSASAAACSAAGDAASRTCPSPDAVAGGTASAATSLAAVVLGGGLASFLRTVLLNRARDGIAARLRCRTFAALLTERDVEWFSGGEGDGVLKEGGGGDGDDDDDDVENKAEGKVDGGEKTEDAPAKPSVSSSPGAIGATLNEDVNRISDALTTNLANAVRSTCSVLFATGNMIQLNPSLLGLSVGVVPFVGAAAVVLNKFVKTATARQREASERAAAFAEERLGHVGTVRTSCRESDEAERYASLQGEAVRLGRRVSMAKGTFMGFTFAASSGALFLVFSAGGRAVAAGRMTSGELTSFATYTFLLGLGTSGIVKAMGEMAQGMVSAERVYGLMDGDADGKANEGSAAVAAPSNAPQTINPDEVDSISLESVTFSYRSDPTKSILRDVSLTLARGRVVALVGRNGSGKSTLASLLTALHVPRSGAVRVSPLHLDLHALSRRDQSSLVQIVPQRPALFDDTVRANVTYADPEASEGRVREALTAANCDGFLSKLDGGGLEFRVGRDGARLSGGQRQRLALARALLSDPAVMVLDEPTASLDREGEGAVEDAIALCRNGHKRRGLLLITHTAKALERADEIVVLKDGKIVERGTYSELTGSEDSELCGLYPELASSTAQ